MAEEVAKTHGYVNQNHLIWYKPNKKDGGGDRLMQQFEHILVVNNCDDAATQFSMEHGKDEDPFPLSIRSNILVFNTLQVRMP